MPRRCGIDTSILTGEPAQDFDRVVAALTHLVEVEHVALLASHMVIGEQGCVMHRRKLLM
jgi:hypothetical protein